MGDVELPYHVKFTYPANLQNLIHDLILGLTYSAILTYTVMFPYPVKYSVRNSTFLFMGNHNQLQKPSGLNDF